MITLTLSEQDIEIIGAALNDIPYKYAAPIINKINKQIAEIESQKSN